MQEEDQEGDQEVGVVSGDEVKSGSIGGSQIVERETHIHQATKEIGTLMRFVDLVALGIDFQTANIVGARVAIFTTFIIHSSCIYLLTSHRIQINMSTKADSSYHKKGNIIL